MQLLSIVKRWSVSLISVILMAVTIVALLLTACGEQARSEETDTTETTLHDEEEIWGTAPEETLGVAVDTPYISFCYPEEWRDKVESELSSEGANSVVTFRTEISGKKVELFSIAMGPDECAGYLLGKLNDETEGAIKVYTVVNEIDINDWSQEEYGQICAMQERINDIIVQINEDERFEPA